MILPLVILYVVTLVYLSITERFRTYASIIGLQGWILFGVIRRTHIHRVRTSGSSQFNALLLSVGAAAAAITLTAAMADGNIDRVFFGVALYAVLSGLILIVVRSRIFSHMVGFLVIENGVFLFSMAVGTEMPFLINVAILLDIMISVLMLGIFFMRIGNKLHADDADSLTNVKD